MITDTHLSPALSGNNIIDLTTTALDVRNKALSIKARANRIASILTSPGAHPSVIARAKDELAALYKEAGELWSTL